MLRYHGCCVEADAYACEDSKTGSGGSNRGGCWKDVSGDRAGDDGGDDGGGGDGGGDGGSDDGGGDGGGDGGDDGGGDGGDDGGGDGGGDSGGDGGDDSGGDSGVAFSTGFDSSQLDAVAWGEGGAFGSGGTGCTGNWSDECCQVLTGCGAGSGQLAAKSKRALLYKGTFLSGGVVTGG